MTKELMGLVLAGFAAMLAGALVFRLFFAPAEFTSAPPPGIEVLPVSVYQTLGDIQLPDLQDQPRTLTEWDAPLLVVNFWAPWCAPCRREIPALIEIQNRYADQIQLLGLSFDSKQNVLDFMQEIAIDYPLLLVGTESVGLNQFFGNNSGGLPFTAVLDTNRNIVASHTGELDATQLEQMLRPHLP